MVEMRSAGDSVGEGVNDAVGVLVFVCVGVRLPVLCGRPPMDSGVPAGLALAGALGSTTSGRRPLAMALAGAVEVTLASRKQLAAEEMRSSVNAKA